MTVLDCFDQTKALPVALFVGGALVNLAFQIYVWKRPFEEALRVLLGVSSYEKGFVDWCLIIATLALPMVVWLNLQQACFSEAATAITLSE